MMWRLVDYAENIAVIDELGRSYTYSELFLDCKKLSEKFINNSKSQRYLIFNLCENSYGSLVGYVSFLNETHVPLLLDAFIDRELLIDLILRYKPDYLWVPEAIFKELNTLSDELKFKQVYIAHNYTLLKTPYNLAYELYSELALLLTTSGSTGSPKLVRQSYSNIKANIESIVNYLKLTEKERAITTLPMSYTYGLSIINTHLAVGAGIVMTKRTLMQKEFWNQLKENKVTSISGVPYTYEMLDKLRFFRMDLPYLKTMTQAGGKLSPTLHKKYSEFACNQNKHFIVMYGQTEATARMSYLPSEKAVEKCGSIGIAIPGGKFSLIDANDKPITDPGITGELVFTGANVTLGYAENGSDLKKGDQRDGMLYTGDMAKFDEDGYYYIVGRKKRFLKIYGYRTNLDEIEHLIKSKFIGVECACTGIDDKMYIFTTNNSIIEDVRRYIIDKTGFNHMAINVRSVIEIPKTDSGKTLYTALEKYYV